MFITQKVITMSPEIKPYQSKTQFRRITGVRVSIVPTVHILYKYVHLCIYA